MLQNVKNVSKFWNLVTILVYGITMRNKCIQISTNMPDIGLESCGILNIWETKRFCTDGGTNGRVQSINACHTSIDLNLKKKIKFRSLFHELRTNTRRVCTYSNANFMVNPNTAMIFNNLFLNVNTFVCIGCSRLRVESALR